MKDYTHICIVLDASGSMGIIENDIKGSFRSLIKTQKENEGKTVLDLYQFSDDCRRLVKHADLADIKEDLMANYRCSGCTALNDAVCTAIDTLGMELAAMREEDRPQNVVFVIITDGYENASRQHSAMDVKYRIELQSTKYSWDFQYLGANQDAFAVGETLGIAKDNCVNYDVSASGMVYACSSINANVQRIRNRRRK